MSFTGSSFFAFIGIFFALYYLSAKAFPKVQWVFLLAANYVFYSYSTSRYLFFLAFTTFTTWLCAILMAKVDGKAAGRGRKKLYLAMCLCLNIGVLFFLKYTNFFLGMAGRNLEGLFLPLGISFYTFQSIGYCMDVYRGMAEPERNFFRYALYLSFFPQISQGPIGKYDDLAPQLRQIHFFEYGIFTGGLARAVLGYFKKVVVANNIGIWVDQVYGSYSSYAGCTLFAATVLYGLQLYADFSGYMDIALGVGECLGVRLAENFRTPYFSGSISEFWRRWHISLGAWFRDYLYYPILRSPLISKAYRKLSKAGHRKAAGRLTAVVGLGVTWTVIGFWHGAAWKYVAYGWYHGLFVVMDACLGDRYKAVKGWLCVHEKSKPWAAFQVVRTFLIVNFGYVLFRAPSLRSAFLIYKTMLAGVATGNLMTVLGDMHSLGRAYWILLLAGLLFCLVIEIIEEKRKFAEWLDAKAFPVRWGILYFMIAMVLLYILNQPADKGNFIYFNF